MSCSWSRALCAVAALLFAVAVPREAGAAGTTVVKMATLAPEGSSWYKVLFEMGEEWKRVSGGTVTLRIYPGGVVGDEDAMLRKMRVGQLQAAAVTGLGLANIDKAFYALHVPMMYASDEEFDYVRDRVAPVLERRLEEKGLIVLTWGDAGWVRFFAKKPFSRPAEVKAMKLFVGAGDTNLVQLYKEAGFQPVSLSTVDILPGLQTGLINSFSTTPLAALAFQWFALAPNMAEFKWSPLTGATIIDRKVWLRIPADVRAKLLAASQSVGQKLRGEIRRLNDEAVKVMVKNGLNVIRVSPAVVAEWSKVVEDIYPRIRGGIIPADMFDLARRYRDEYRTLHAGKGRARSR